MGGPVMSHTIANINNLVVKIIDADINTIPTAGQTAHRTSGSFALGISAGADVIISEHIIRRKGSNKCQLLIIYEDNSP